MNISALKPFGKRGVLIQWQEKINENILKEVLALKSFLLENKNDYLYINHTYSSILIYYKASIDFQDEKTSLLNLINEAKKSDYKLRRKTWEIPVCIHKEIGIDLEYYCQNVNLESKDVIQKFCTPLYLLYFNGFLPGFMYLGGLDKQLHLDRKKTPSRKIPKGAVAIGGKQAGIYPQESPGGWHIIGQTPLPLFDVNQKPPVPLEAGDQIRFSPISLEDFHEIKSSSNLTIKSFTHV